MIILAAQVQIVQNGRKIHEKTREMNPEKGRIMGNVMQSYHTFKGPDGDFNYIDWGGSGPLAHFAHATGFCAGTYTPIAGKLCHRLRVLGMDDRGHGRTTAEADPRNLKNWNVFAEDLEQFFKHLREPVIAIGHSRGAVASLLLAVKRPDMIRALILIDPTILPFSWMWWWYLAKKTGFARRVPIAARAARRNPFWPDTETILNYLQGKAPVQIMGEGFPRRLHRGWNHAVRQQGHPAVLYAGVGVTLLFSLFPRYLAIYPADPSAHPGSLWCSVGYVFGPRSETVSDKNAPCGYQAL